MSTLTQTPATGTDRPILHHGSLAGSLAESLSEYVTRPQGMQILGTTSKLIFGRAVLIGEVGTRQLPGEPRIRYRREDLERVAREAIRPGRPQRSA